MEYLLLGLIVLAVPVMGVAGFVMAMNARGRIRLLEERLARLEAGAVVSSQAAIVPEPPPAPAEAVEPVEPAVVEPARAVEEPPAAPGDAIPPPAAPQAAAGPTPPRQSLEEIIGTRWAVWLGGIALGLGGLFLVRYAIDQGFFGPTARIVSGALFALLLLAGGEWMRRREAFGPPATLSLGRLPPAPVPAVLTAAGTLSAFATAYAAHALYGMIGPATAFVLLGAIGIATMAAAALHGPWLAGLGLVAAFVAPLLVESADPRPWPVVIYLAVIAGSAYALSRIRLWLWLALATAAGSAMWGFVIIEGAFRHHLEAFVHILVQAGLAVAFLAFDPHRRDEDPDARTDRVATAVLAVFAALAAYKLQVAGLGLQRPVFAGLLAVLLWGAALRIPAVAAGGLLAAGVVVAALIGWPVASEAAREPVTVLPGAPSSPPMPDALWQFILLSLLAGGALPAGALVRLVRSPVIAPVPTGLYAAAGTAGPLAILVAGWWSVADFARSIPFALVAAAMAVAYVAAAGLFRRLAGDAEMRSARFGLEATAAAAIAAIAAGLTMVLEQGGLTVALALSAAGAAWVTTRERVGTLRYAVGVLGAVVLGRLIWDPTIVAGDPGALPILNWLLWGYGVPAVAFGLASVWLRRQRDDQVVALAEALSIAFTAFLLMAQIRHAVTGTLDIREPGHLEAGLQAFASLTLGGVLVWLEITRRSLVIRAASYLFGAVALGWAVLGLLIFANPLLSGSERVIGGAVFNSLLPGYLLPAIAAVGLSIVARGRRPRWFCRAALGLGFVLQFLWMVMEIRHLFRGPDIAFWRSTSDAEIYSYSAAFLVVGLVLLAVGVLRGSQTARLASAVYILLTVGKVFLVDMDGLTGVWRALSFIGLGLALVGIGLVYQKWVFARPRGALPPPPAAPEPGPSA